MPEFYDISRILEEGMEVWPGDPEFRREWVARIRGGAPANVSALHLGVHTGTHLDAPLHVDDAGSDVARLPVGDFIGPARVFGFDSAGGVRAADLAGLDWRGVERALFRWGAPGPGDCAGGHGFLHDDAARYLAGKGLRLVGTDAPGVDAPGSADLSAHRILLGGGVAILENLCLGGVPPGDYELICLPLKIAGSDGSPVRAVLRRRTS
ncbi:MAG: cyclase family protein [Acidobacteria bacterium]|nr:cyclase family protein [Acidobacteriota bacterium]